MNFRFYVLGLSLSTLLIYTPPVLGQSSATQTVPGEDSSYIDGQGTAHITRVVEVPQTISPEAQKALAKEGNPPASHDTPPKMPQPRQTRQMTSDATKALYPVNIAFSTIAEIPVSIVTPLVTPADKANRVLINLHGGGFSFPDSGSLTESIPVANLTQNPRVVSVLLIAPAP